MLDVHILTSILVPSTTNGPSLDSLQWSPDGQVFVVTRSAIHILTPSPGINFDPSSAVTSSLSQSADRNINVQPLGFYRTIIELEKTIVHHWPLESQGWGSVSLGALDVSWCSITLSPSNLSRESSCILAALNSNLEVSLWAPGKNYLTGAWNKEFLIQDVTQVLKEMELTDSSALSRTLSAQVHSISWSPQIELGEDTDHIDGSLLALGNRAGQVVFMQLLSFDEGVGLQHVSTVTVSDDWLHHLSWSCWRKAAPDHFQTFIACGVSDGGVIIVSVSLFLEHSSTSMASLRFQFELLDEGKSCCPSDNAGITALSWIESKHYASILAYTKPGMIYLQTFPSDRPLGWTNRRAFNLKLQPISSNSTSCAAASGLVYYEQNNALVICLYDGSFHVIHDVWTAPSLYTLDRSLSSEELTRQVRGVFAMTESSVNFSDANRTSGVCSYDGAGTVMWLHEKCNPDDLSYKHESKQTSMFVVTRLWRNDSFLFEQLVSTVAGGSIFDASPIHALRGPLLHLLDNTFSESHQGRIFELLTQFQETDQISAAAPKKRLLESEGSDDRSLRKNFRRFLATDIFRSQHMRSRRLRFVLATYCSSMRQSLSPFANLAEEIRKSILCNHLRTVIRRIDGVVSRLQDIDRSFVHRWITQSLAQGVPLLQDEAVALAHRVGVPIDSPLESPDFGEQCPACHAIVPLVNSSTAGCSKGHIWARCSVTTFLLVTPYVRTCIGCSRKALLPLSVTPPTCGGHQRLPPAATSWLVQELLEAANWCIYCGNRFVRVLYAGRRTWHEHRVRLKNMIGVNNSCNFSALECYK